MNIEQFKALKAGDIVKSKRAHVLSSSPSGTKPLHSKYKITGSEEIPHRDGPEFIKTANCIEGLDKGTSVRFSTKYISGPESLELDCSTYWEQRQALKNTEITSAESIADLPWHGNHASDMGLFIACDIYIKAQAAAGNKEEAKKAIWQMGKSGIGIDGPVTEEAYQSYITGNWEQKK